jgi:hypothetical protein
MRIISASIKRIFSLAPHSTMFRKGLTFATFMATIAESKYAHVDLAMQANARAVYEMLVLTNCMPVDQAVAMLRDALYAHYCRPGAVVRVELDSACYEAEQMDITDVLLVARVLWNGCFVAVDIRNFDKAILIHESQITRFVAAHVPAAERMVRLGREVVVSSTPNSFVYEFNHTRTTRATALERFTICGTSYALCFLGTNPRLSCFNDYDMVACDRLERLTTCSPGNLVGGARVLLKSTRRGRVACATIDRRGYTSVIYEGSCVPERVHVDDVMVVEK